MRYLLFFFSLSFCLHGQTLLTENFNNFFPSGLDSTVALYKGYSNPLTDLSTYGNTNTLTAGGSAGDSVTAIAVLQKDSSVVYFNSVTPQYLNRPAANADDFNTGTGDFTWEALIHAANINQHGYILSKILSSGAYTGVHLRITDATVATVGKRIAVQVRKDAANTRLLVSNSDIVDGQPHHIALVRSGTTNVKVYVDASEIAMTALTTAGTDININSVSNFSVGVWSNLTTLPFVGHIEYVRVSRKALTQSDIKKAVYLASGWESLNEGVARNGWEYHQGIVNDTIYYSTPLTAGHWNVTVKDSAASGVNYQILTSADAATWTTLATGTTGTAWSSKPYSGAGTGYIAIAVASGTAFFDDLVVTLASGEKNGFGGYSGKYKGWGKY